MKTILIALAMVTGGQEGDDLTPAQVLKLMEEALRHMGWAEALLNEERAEKAEERERDAARALQELLERSLHSKGREGDGRDARRDRRPGSAGRPPTGGGDTPKRDGSTPSKFHKPSESWGLLPPGVLRAMREASFNEVPAQFQEWWSRYFKTLSGQC